MGTDYLSVHNLLLLQKCNGTRGSRTCSSRTCSSRTTTSDAYRKINNLLPLHNLAFEANRRRERNTFAFPLHRWTNVLGLIRTYISWFRRTDITDISWFTRIINNIHLSWRRNSLFPYNNGFMTVLWLKLSSSKDSL